MENYNEMQQKITQFAEERNSQRAALDEAVAAAEAALATANNELEAAVADGDVDMVTQKNSEVQIKAAALAGLRKQLAAYLDPRISAADFHALRAELRDFTTAQQAEQYAKLKNALDDAEQALIALDQIRDQHNDIYIGLENLTYDSSDSPVDSEGHAYNRGGLWDKKPVILYRQIQERTTGNLRQTVDLMVERYPVQ